MTETPLHTRSRIRHVAFAGTSAILLACMLALSGLSRAFAEDIDTNPTADGLQLEVERTAAAYDEALAAAEKAEADLAENEGRIAELEQQIPVQQKRSDDAARELYKFQKQRMGFVELLLSAEDFFSFLTNWEYIDRIAATNVAEINRLTSMKAELTERQTALAEAKKQADASAAEALRALTAAQEARLEAQRKAQEAARQAAEANAAARGAAGAGTQDGSAANEAIANAADEAVAAVDDGADWSSDEAAFIESWAGRIDAYLAGSPLGGQGRTFAQAAWNYGVDPRWSPAIAFTESSLGRYCFLPHNAWGWGSISWGSWEEAIDAHVRGLARGYGYTITPEAAQKYCPPTWDSWYNTTLGQMNLI